jgi:hypothetical protein
MNVDQLADDLARAAARVELRPGSVARARTEGRRRRYRRRRAGVAVTAAAAVGVTGLAVRQLSRPSPTVSSTTETVPATTPGVAPPTSTGAAPVAVTEVESPFVWTRVDPDSASAVGSSYDANLRAASTPVPGLIVSTAPGQHDHRRMLWQTADGVHWTQAGPLPTGATTAAATTRGDQVYVVGTMPGATGDTVGPVRVSISDDAGVNWRGIDLPTANPGLEAVAGGRPVRTGIGGVAATDDVTLVLVRQSVDPADLTTLVEGLGLGELAQAQPDGLAVYSCDPDPDRADGATVPAPTAPAHDGSCPLRDEPDRVVPFAELGASGATVQAMMTPQQRLFRSTDGATFSEVAVPASGAVHDTVLSAVGDEFVIATRHPFDGRMTTWWSVDGSAWSEAPGGPRSSARIGQLGSGLVSVPEVGGIAVDIDRDGSGTWQRADLTALLDPGEEGLGMYTVAADAVGFTGAAIVGTPNPDYVEPSYPGVEGTVPMPTSPTGTGAPVLPYSETHFDIVHTADGVTWSRESVADLAGVDPAEVAAVTRIQHTVDGGVVVAVSLKVPEGELPRQLVLVGTPKG